MQLHKCASLSDLNYICFPHFQKYASLATWQTGLTWVWMRSSRPTRAPGAGVKEAEVLSGAEAGEQQGEGESLRFKLEQHWNYFLSGQVRGRSASRARSQENGARARSRSRGPSQVGHVYTRVLVQVVLSFFIWSETIRLISQLWTKVLKVGTFSWRKKVVFEDPSGISISWHFSLLNCILHNVSLHQVF